MQQGGLDAEEGKAVFYNVYQKKGETGKEADDEFELDHEAAEAAWPNFYDTFKGHPSLGPGVVEDSSVVREVTTTSEQDLPAEPTTSNCATCTNYTRELVK